MLFLKTNFAYIHNLARQASLQSIRPDMVNMEADIRPAADPLPQSSPKPGRVEDDVEARQVQGGPGAVEVVGE